MGDYALPGTIHDGRRMYDHLKGRGFTVTWMRDDPWVRSITNHYRQCDSCEVTKTVNAASICRDCFKTKLFPTKANIEKQLINLATITMSGDVAWLVYSGHGEKESDSSGSEEDGEDECICPTVDYDAPTDEWDYDNITDDWLRKEFVYRLEPGSETVAIFDCCHSGTILDLPYQYRDDQWRLDNSWRKHMRGDAFVLCLSACRDDETATGFGAKRGSALLCAFHKILSKKGYDVPLRKLLTNVQREVRRDDQEPRLSCSHPIRLD